MCQIIVSHIAELFLNWLACLIPVKIWSKLILWQSKDTWTAKNLTTHTISNTVRAINEKFIVARTKY